MNCSRENKHLFDWIINAPEYETRIHLNCDLSIRNAIWSHNWGICNYFGEKNGQYDVSYWPPVDYLKYSIVNCLSGVGRHKWLCEENGEFNETGPVYECSLKSCDCWLDQLIEMPMNSYKDVLELSIALDENLSKTSSSINLVSSLKIILGIIHKIGNFLQDNLEDTEKSERIGNELIKILSKVIDQSNAWNNCTDSEKQKMSDKIIFLIKMTSFSTNCYSNSSKNTKEIFSKNIFQKLFFNYSQNIFVGFEFSSISVSQFENNLTKNDSVEEKCILVTFIRNMQDYMRRGLKGSQRINSVIIGLNSSKPNISLLSNEEYSVRIRFDR